jgi:hypothetical protein
MAKITVQDFVQREHPNHMRYIDNAQMLRHQNSQGLTPYKVCLVDVCGFRFIFHSVMQIELCRDYFSKKIHPSSRLPVYRENLGGDHSETQRWFEKLPARLFHHSKRPKVTAALETAVIEFGKFPEACTDTKMPSLASWTGKD